MDVPAEVLSSDEVIKDKEDKNAKDDTGGEEPASDCPICLQQPLHPVRLPCGHIFCYLCSKGEVLKRSRCALCRREIPPEYFFEPNLLEQDRDQTHTKQTREGFWFYEGRQGWWQYDERSMQEIEREYQTGKQKIEMLITGSLYIIDFAEMRQYRVNYPGRFRRIKRDARDIPIKGVAGLKIGSNVSGGAASVNDASSEDNRSQAEGNETAEATAATVASGATAKAVAPILASSGAINIGASNIPSPRINSTESGSTVRPNHVMRTRLQERYAQEQRSDRSHNYTANVSAPSSGYRNRRGSSTEVPPDVSLSGSGCVLTSMVVHPGPSQNQPTRPERRSRLSRNRSVTNAEDRALANSAPSSPRSQQHRGPMPGRVERRLDSETVSDSSIHSPRSEGSNASAMRVRSDFEAGIETAEGVMSALSLRAETSEDGNSVNARPPKEQLE